MINPKHLVLLILVIIALEEIICIFISLRFLLRIARNVFYHNSVLTNYSGTN